MRIFFNKPYSTGKELEFIRESINSGHTSGNGPFTIRCIDYLENICGYKYPLLTSSCTDAIEMSSLLIDIKPGDEVIVPAYTFVSTALAFSRQGAKIVFSDSRNDNPCIDEEMIEGLITKKTKAIIPVHYAGISCNMDRIMDIAEKNKLFVIEDAAHAFGSRYKDKTLGTIGHIGCISFHETKVVHCGEGGMLSVNMESLKKRSEVIWEKGTNRCDFHRKAIAKYEWTDLGSSFLMSDITAAFLFSQLQGHKKILELRKNIWEYYYDLLKESENQGFLKLPYIPEYARHNYSVFYIITRNANEREKLILKLMDKGIQAVSHYLDLSKSPFIKRTQPVTYRKSKVLKNAMNYQDTVLRLPLYPGLKNEEVEEAAFIINNFYK